MNSFTELLGIDLPIIGGAMYPCSNPELVAAVSNAGGIGIVQPLSLTYVHGYDFREGLRYNRTLTPKPIGLNLIVEQSSSIYLKRMQAFLDIAIEEGVRFFITALGNPDFVVRAAHQVNGIVFHDVTERKWALKAIKHHVDGLICVNNEAGGHAGRLSPQALYDELKDLGLPLICAGGIGDEFAFKRALDIGYSGVQLGTRLIATTECHEKSAYKQAILEAEPSDIVHTLRVTGVPLAVINTPYVQQIGTRVSPLAAYLLQNRFTKNWMRLFYSLRSIRRFKEISLKGASTRDYYQAGKSVGGIDKIEPVQVIFDRFRKVLLRKD
ncbi:MAG: NAD(P)H-dependent flavin oxidoreductase [Parachlamydiaceae bacterium]